MNIRFFLYTLRIAIAITIALTATSCREDSIVFPPEQNEVTDPVQTFSEISGFYLLNEGNMGSNKSTLDRFDYATGVYTRNIYAEANPDVPKELGDVGNDLQIYGSRLYAVINCSNKVEVMDAATARRIAQALELPSAPKQFIHYFEEPDRPQAKLDRELEGGMAVSMGRLRPDTQYDYKFVGLSHNTLRGAAGGAVLLAELLCAEGYIDHK